MIQVTVISGKGGTGKTTVSAAFHSLATKHVMADCDVDASNLHLVLNPEITKTEEFSGLRIPEVTDKCITCGICVDECPEDALIQITPDSKPHLEQLFCEGCGICSYVCPKKAIDLIPRHSGMVYSGSVQDTPFANAKLFAGEEISGKLVSAVREKAVKLANKHDRDIIIIDGSPGIGCPVIASITGTDYIVAVSEPTPSGLHDLSRVVELAEHFQIPLAVIVNKADLNDTMTKKIENYCNNNEVEFLGTLPYDSEVVTALINGKSIIEADPENAVSLKIKEIWNNLLSILKSKTYQKG